MIGLPPMKPISCIALALLVFGPPLRAADDYQGAGALLGQLAAKTVSGPTAVSPAAQWLDDIEAYRKNSASLDPEEAARQWVDLAARSVALSPIDEPADQLRLARLHGSQLQDSVIGLLPGPAAWTALARIVDARPAPSQQREAIFEDALRLLAHTLIADPAGQRKALEAIAGVKDNNFAMLTEGLDIDSLEDALANQSDDPASVAAAFKAKIAREKKEIAEAAQNGRASNGTDFAVPDLVTLLGEKEAAPLLGEAILLPNVRLAINGAETKRLAAKLALDQVPNLKSPHWELACSLDAAPLYEALEKRFPDAATRPDAGDFVNAGRYFFLHLVVNGQTDRAVEMAGSLNADATSSWMPLDALESAGYTRQVYDFLHGLLAKHPELPFWDDYITLAAKTGETGQMLDLIRSVANSPKLSESERSYAHRSFYLALLAADQIDEGVAELRKVTSVGDQAENMQVEKEVALARIGQLLGRQDLLDEGVAAAKKHLLGGPPAELNESSEPVTSLAELLTQAGRGPEAEKVLAQAVSQARAKTPYLAALVRLYYHANRPADILAVLEKFPGWNAPDLTNILTEDTEGFSIAEYSTHAAGDNLTVGYMAAWALAKSGEKERALSVDNAVLDQDGSFDPGYELLTNLSGTDAIPRLDLLARRDRFETRPLIWKAQLQLDAGQLDAAEKTIRAAIVIDPSDGEQGPGRRMRAYSVLADVLDKKGDEEHARIYRGAVTAIRMSERADRFYEAGLLSRAVKMYEEALTHFADAYCIQSRLALRLSELGDNAGAEEHYRRAYELMPESFGRVESHCFGCERAFEGVNPQRIAEQVFTQLAAKTPDKPQVHYLLGYLRMEQERYAEALPEFREAVKLDPDYLNAWKKIGEVGQQMHLPTKLRNEVVLNEVRLDPLQRHAQPQAEDVTDLAGLWNAVAAAKDLDPPRPSPLMPLDASAAELKKNINSGQEPTEYSVLYDSSKTPAECIAINRFVAAVSRVFSALPMWGGRPEPF